MKKTVEIIPGPSAQLLEATIIWIQERYKVLRYNIQYQFGGSSHILNVSIASNAKRRDGFRSLAAPYLCVSIVAFNADDHCDIQMMTYNLNSINKILHIADPNFFSKLGTLITNNLAH